MLNEGIEGIDIEGVEGVMTFQHPNKGGIKP